MLSKTLKNENFYESGDFELVLQYYDFLLRMRKSLSEKNKDDAKKIGLGIREFFFINNSVSEKNKSQVSNFNMPSKMLSLTGLLTTGFCGVLNEIYFEDNDSRKEIIEDSVFLEFISSIDVSSCFKTQYDLVLGEIKYSEFVDAVSKSAREMPNAKTRSKTMSKTKTRSKTMSKTKTRSKTNSLHRKTRRKPKVYI